MDSGENPSPDRVLIIGAHMVQISPTVLEKLMMITSRNPPCFTETSPSATEKDSDGVGALTIQSPSGHDSVHSIELGIGPKTEPTDQEPQKNPDKTTFCCLSALSHEIGLDPILPEHGGPFC